MKEVLTKWGIRIGIFVAILLLLFLFRRPILRGVGNFLVKTDPPAQVDAAFILSGAAKERTDRALELFMEYTPGFVTMGGNVSQALKAMGMSYTDAEVMRDALIAAGVDSISIAVLPRGTSTYEESEEILGYALSRGFDRIMIVTSLHHTRRVHGVFVEKFRESGIEVLVMGAEPEDFEPDSWWQNEEGLIFIFNEYAKLLYYAWRY